jgi:hypothetical protein
LLPVIVSHIPYKDRWEGSAFKHHAAYGQQVVKEVGTLFIDLAMKIPKAYCQIGATAVEAHVADASRAHK